MSTIRVALYLVPVPCLKILDQGSVLKTFSVRNLLILVLSSTRLEMLAKDKHCSLLVTIVNYDRKNFYDTGHTGRDVAAH